MTQTIELNYRDLFRTEIRQAKALGYTIGIAIAAHGNNVVVRLTPTNDRARHNVKTASGNPDTQGIEATCPFDGGHLDAALAIRDALNEALTMAQDAA